MNEKQRRALWGAADCCATCLGGVIKRLVDERADTAYLVGYRRGREAVLAELGFCPADLEPMPCLTCGAGL